LPVDVLWERVRQVVFVQPDPEITERLNWIDPRFDRVHCGLRKPVWEIVRMLPARAVPAVQLSGLPVSAPHPPYAQVGDGVLIKRASFLDHVHYDVRDLSEYREVPYRHLIIQQNPLVKVLPGLRDLVCRVVPAAVVDERAE